MSWSHSSSLGVYILPEAERLTKANWADWSARIYLVCQVRGLEPYLLGTILPPSARTTTTSPLSASPLPPASPASDDDGPLTPELIPTPLSPVLPSQASLYVPTPTAISAFFPISTPVTAPSSAITYTTMNSEWRERDIIARAHLVLNVADITGTGITVIGTAADAWTSLRNRFELQDLVIIQDMWLRLTMTWYEDGTSMVAKRSTSDPSGGDDAVIAMVVETDEEGMLTMGQTSLLDQTLPFFDSGAMYHYFADRHDFVTYEPLSRPGSGRAAGPNGFTIAGSGLVVKDAMVGGKRVTHCLQAVHAPDMGQNLLSTRQFDRKGGRVWSEKGRIIITNVAGERLFESTTSAAGLYEVPLFQPSAEAILHHRTKGSMSRPGITASATGLQATACAATAVDGMVILPGDVVGICEDCMAGQQARRPFDEVVEHKQEIGERIHGNLMGPCQQPHLGANAEETLAAAKSFVSWLEMQTGRPVRHIRTDNGTEFVNDAWRSWCQEQGIIHETSAPYSLSQNGMLERGNRTWMEHARSMMHNGGIPTHLWAEALATAVYIQNLLPSSRHPTCSSWEMIFKHHPPVEHLRTYDSVGYAKIPDECRTKLDAKSIKCVLVGYQGRDAYRLYEPNAGRVFTSRDVVFDEGTGHWSRTGAVDVEGESDLGNVNNDSEPDKSTEEEEKGAVTALAQALNPPQTNPPQTPPQSAAALAPPDAPCRSNRISKPSNALLQSHEYAACEVDAHTVGEDWAADALIANLASSDGLLADLELADDVLAFIANSSVILPKMLEEAMEHPDLWQEAVERELGKMREYGVWDVVPLPKGAELMDYRWVFAKKFDSDGNVTGRKARLVGKGYSQRFGVNFLWTFASVVRLETVRTALALTAALDLEIWQIDFESAFLNAPVDSDIYMRQPKGFEEPGKEELLDRTYQCLGYTRMFADYCARAKTSDGQHTITLMHTDDTLGLSTSPAESARAKAELGAAYWMKDMGGPNDEPEFILGIKVERDCPRKTICISQCGFLLHILDRAGMSECSIEPTPLPAGGAYQRLFKLMDDSEREACKGEPFRELLGAVNYLAVATRLDISYAVQVLSSFSNAPGTHHWKALKHLLRYLKGTADHGITYDGTRPDGLRPIGYFDANYAIEQNCRSSTGWVFLLAGAPVAWSLKKQQSVAISTTEAEYMAAAAAAQTAIWLRMLLRELEVPISGPGLLLGDNMSANIFTREYVNHSRAKHIDVRYHFVRERVEAGELEVEHVSSANNLADVLTKGIPRDHHKELSAPTVPSSAHAATCAAPSSTRAAPSSTPTAPLPVHAAAHTAPSSTRAVPLSTRAAPSSAPTVPSSVRAATRVAPSSTRAVPSSAPTAPSSARAVLFANHPLPSAARTAPSSTHAAAATTTPTDEAPSSTGARKWSNNDIPTECLSKWHDTFMPMWLEFMGRCTDPWDTDLVEDAQVLWDFVFPDVPKDLAAKEATIYQVAIQRVYQWRNMIATATNKAVEKFWIKSGDIYEDADKKAEFVDWAVPMDDDATVFPFLWGDVDRYPDFNATVHVGAFRSKFVLRSYCAHLQAIASVPLNVRGEETPIGAIALSTVAVERALRAWSTGVYEKQDLKGKGPFSSKNCGLKTSEYVSALEEKTADGWRKLLADADAILEAEHPDVQVVIAAINGTALSIGVMGRMQCVDVKSEPESF
ncbi:hypothetical protein EW146_g6813 [Bondarzewia mesenterica]|uniref:Integrase catalytic domain-containing protein n=1 Tax=Bondarzewia mesenterica TaxID=1095465 RepID=A0A4S4LNA1_9AGAM|nr:hypothetical protein EW146_g6813 [Bondarzewia mesenterica]